MQAHDLPPPRDDVLPCGAGPRLPVAAVGEGALHALAQSLCPNGFEVCGKFRRGTGGPRRCGVEERLAERARVAMAGIGGGELLAVVCEQPGVIENRE